MFEPVVVHNNTQGDADARVRERFGEPAWNNPVVRIVRPRDGGTAGLAAGAPGGATAGATPGTAAGAHERDWIPRIAERWTVAALADGMVAALRAAERPVPAWLEALRAEHVARARSVATAAFGMT